jgi:hypothetical protein
VTFTGGTGGLVLNDPSGFSGQIIGFTGTAPDAAHSDTIDLVGINYNSANFAESYNSTTGLLMVTDGSNSASFTFDNFNATLDFASDGDGGTLITDPPATGSSSDSSSTAANGSASDGWHAMLGDDQIHFASDQTLSQSSGVTGTGGQNVGLNQTASVSIGGPGNDNFVFHPELGAATNANSNPHLDTNEPDNHPDIHSAQHLASLITPDPHVDWMIDLVHNDILKPAGMNITHWHQMVTSVVHLH